MKLVKAVVVAAMGLTVACSKGTSGASQVANDSSQATWPDLGTVSEERKAEAVAALNGQDWKALYEAIMPGIGGYEGAPIRVTVEPRSGSVQEVLDAQMKVYEMTLVENLWMDGERYINCSDYEECWNGFLEDKVSASTLETLATLSEHLKALVGPKEKFYTIDRSGRTAKAMPIRKLVDWGYETKESVKRWGGRFIEGGFVEEEIGMDGPCVFETADIERVSGCYGIGWVTTYMFITDAHVVSINAIYGHQ